MWNDQDQNFFTAKDAEDAKGSKTLPLMNTDDTDFRRVDEEFVPAPWGMDSIESG